MMFLLQLLLFVHAYGFIIFDPIALGIVTILDIAIIFISFLCCYLVTSQSQMDVVVIVNSGSLAVAAFAVVRDDALSLSPLSAQPLLSLLLSYSGKSVGR